MSSLNTKVQLQVASFDINSAADKGTMYVPPGRWSVVYIWVLPLGTDTGGATIKFDSALAGSAGSRGDGDVGVITIPASDQQDNMIYETPANSSGGIPVILEAGDKVVVQVTAEGGGSTNAIAGMVLEEYPEQPGNLTYMVATSN
jgi:hypothetical protein